MNRQTHQLWSALLLRSFLICVGFQLFVFAMLVFVHDWGYAMHSKFFDISIEAFDLSAYCMLGAMKLFGLLVFLIPWLALQSVRGRITD